MLSSNAHVSVCVHLFMPLETSSVRVVTLRFVSRMSQVPCSSVVCGEGQHRLRDLSEKRHRQLEERALAFPPALACTHLLLWSPRGRGAQARAPLLSDTPLCAQGREGSVLTSAPTGAGNTLPASRAVEGQPAAAAGPERGSRAWLRAAQEQGWGGGGQAETARRSAGLIRGGGAFQPADHPPSRPAAAAGASCSNPGAGEETEEHSRGGSPQDLSGALPSLRTGVCHLSGPVTPLGLRCRPGQVRPGSRCASRAACAAPACATRLRSPAEKQLPKVFDSLGSVFHVFKWLRKCPSLGNS